MSDLGSGAILRRLSQVRAEIDEAARMAGRNPAEVALLLATKTQPAERILVALTAGYHLIGENRAQEVVAKADDLRAVAHDTHFIGHLQVNKINQLLEHISCLQTLDSIDLAERLNSRLAARDRELHVLIQVNVSDEPSKSGVAPGDVRELLAGTASLQRLTVRGFMTVGLNSPDRSAVRAGYRMLARIRDSVLAEGVPGAEAATELSMGMSGDFADAIAEGATIVRIGSAVFGERPPVRADPNSAG